MDPTSRRLQFHQEKGNRQIKTRNESKITKIQKRRFSIDPKWHRDSSVSIEKEDEGVGKTLRILGYGFPAIVT